MSMEMTQFAPYDALIFDMDGTLIDTMPIHEKAWRLVGEKFGRQFNTQIMYDLGGATVHRIARQMMVEAQLSLDKFDEVIAMKRELAYQLVPNEAKLLPTFEVVRHFYGKKTMAIGSGSHRKLIEMIMEKLTIADFFNAIVSATEVKEHKPSPETFLRCAQLLAVDPTRCIVFEDADLGIQAALAAKMDVFDVRTQQLIRSEK